MQLKVTRLWIVLLLALVPASSACAQKVRIGYDKSADFSRYTSYTWAEPNVPPARPLLYATIVGSIENELHSKGLAQTQADGDLVLVPAGGIGFGLNSAAGQPILGTYGGGPAAIDATMWTGAGGSAAAMTTIIPEGTLTLSFVDRRANKVVWSGTVSVKLDLEHKTKSVELIYKAISKLLQGFPPRKK